MSRLTRVFAAQKYWGLAFVGFLLLFLAWSSAAPYDGTPDEREHIVRAAGVAEGQIAPKPAAAKNGSGAFQTVPSGLVRAQCWQFNPNRSAACAQPPGSGDTPTRTGTGAGRYFPFYYSLVGWPLVLWPGWSGVLLARLISAAICAALLACAYVVILRRSRHQLMVAALVAAVTPMTLQMGSAVNPNGPEIAATVAFFAALIPLLIGTPLRSSRGLLTLVGVSGLMLAMLRQTGPLWIAAGLLALAFPLRSSNLRQLIRRPAVWLWSALVAVATVAAAIWIVVMKTSDLANYTIVIKFSRSQAALAEADRWRSYLDQMVGVTSWLDTRMPSPVYLLWEFTAASLVVGALIVGRWLDRWRLLVLLLAGVAVPSLLQIRSVNTTGFVTQGRYMLPMLAGVLLFCAWVLEERGLNARYSQTAIRLTVLMAAPLQVFCLVFTMVRWQRGLPRYPGLSDLNPLRGRWHPVLGSVTPLACLILGLAIIGWLAWRSPARARRLAAAQEAPGLELSTGSRTNGNHNSGISHRPDDLAIGQSSAIKP